MPKNTAPWKKVVAFAIVAVMVASAYVMIAPGSSKSPVAPEDDTAKAAVGVGPRSITYEISHLGETYLKPTDYSKLGRSDHTQPGINEWYIPRNTNYNDTIVHNSWPYVIAYNGYSDHLVNQAKYKYLKASWTTHMFYQLKVDAENIEGLATGVDADPWIVPIMLPGGVSEDGGWVNMSLYQNYLTDQEWTDIENGVHYGNTFYGAVGADIKAAWKGWYVGDGWVAEIQGHWDFSRRAAHKFLGLPGTGNLVTEYNAVGNTAIATAWADEWIADGDAGMPLDIFAAYDWSLYTGNAPVTVYVKLDTVNSTADKVALWFWSITYGGEYLMMRYLQKVGIDFDLEPSREDWYLNGTFGPANGDIHERMTTTYHMTAWKDPEAYNNPTWMLEPQHMDYTAENLGDQYISQFDPYYWTYYYDLYRPTRMCYAPGIAEYGKAVHYWQTPMNWNLSADESLTIKLPSSTASAWGLAPYQSSNYTVPGNAALEMQANGKTGEMVLGHGYPDTLYSLTYYDPATKTISIPGGTDFAPNRNPAYPLINESGSPLFYFDISPVSHYDLSIVEAGPYSSGTSYTLRVTPLDLSNNPVKCNQTVELPAVAGVTYGSPSHTFAWAEASWDTTVVFASAGDYVLKSQDEYFYLDIADTATFSVVSAAGWDLPLVAGWNFVTIPQFNSYKASTLGLQVSDVVAGWNPATQVYDKNFIVGISPPPLDFTIEPSTGYWVYAGTAETLHLLGSVPTVDQSRTITVPAGGGWAIIGFNSLKTTWHASNIPAMCSGGGTISTVADYDPVSMTYKTYIAGVPPTDYLLVPGHAYWAYCTGSLTLTYTP